MADAQIKQQQNELYREQAAALVDALPHTRIANAIDRLGQVIGAIDRLQDRIDPCPTREEEAAGKVPHANLRDVLVCGGEQIDEFTDHALQRIRNLEDTLFQG